VVAARPVEMPQVATGLTIFVDPDAMSRSQKGTIFGHISFVMGDHAFPPQAIRTGRRLHQRVA